MILYIKYVLYWAAMVEMECQLFLPDFGYVSSLGLDFHGFSLKILLTISHLDCSTGEDVTKISKASSACRADVQKKNMQVHVALSLISRHT